MAYKFQSGDATLSGSVTLVSYQDLLFEADGTSDIGAAAKEVGTIYTTRQTASVGISGSAVYANKLYGNGAGITGISSDTAKTTGSAQNIDLDLVLVQGAGNGKTLAVDSNTKLQFNPSTNKLSLGGELSLVGKLSQSMGNAITGSQFLFRGGTGGNKSFLQLDGNGLLWADSNNADAVTISYGGLLSASNNASIGGTFDAAKNKFSVSAAGVVTAIGNISSTGGNVAATNGNVSASSNLQGQRVNVAENVVAGNNVSGAASLQGQRVAVDENVTAGKNVSGSSMLMAGDQLKAAKNKFSVSTAGALTTLGVDSKLAATDVAIATTDYLYFADATDGDKVKKDAIDDVMKIGVSLLAEAPIAIANDFLVYSDQNDSNLGKRIKMKTFVAAMADGTTITSSNGVLSVVGAQNIDVSNHLGNASYQLTKAGMNYATASIAQNVTYTLPSSPSNGDIVYIKLAGVNAGKHAVISGSAVGNQTIDGVSAITASSAYAGVSLVYVGSNAWRIF